MHVNQCLSAVRLGRIDKLKSLTDARFTAKEWERILNKAAESDNANSADILSMLLDNCTFVDLESLFRRACKHSIMQNMHEFIVRGIDPMKAILRLMQAAYEANNCCIQLRMLMQYNSIVKKVSRDKFLFKKMLEILDMPLGPVRVEL